MNPRYQGLEIQLTLQHRISFFMEDLDNDGDFEFWIINNLNDQAFIYQNLAVDISLGNYLQLNLGMPSAQRLPAFANGNR